MWRDDACVLDMLIAARKIRGFTDGVRNRVQENSG
jgi:hypothetical protein